MEFSFSFPFRGSFSFLSWEPYRPGWCNTKKTPSRRDGEHRQPVFFFGFFSLPLSPLRYPNFLVFHSLATRNPAKQLSTLSTSFPWTGLPCHDGTLRRAFATMYKEGWNKTTNNTGLGLFFSIYFLLSSLVPRRGGRAKSRLVCSSALFRAFLFGPVGGLGKTKNGFSKVVVFLFLFRSCIILRTLVKRCGWDLLVRW